METLFSAQAWNNRKGAMDFPGDPLAPWMDPRDPEHRWWIALAIDGCHNNTYRNGTDGFACVKGGIACEFPQLDTQSVARTAGLSYSLYVLKATRTACQRAAELA